MPGRIGREPAKFSGPSGRNGARGRRNTKPERCTDLNGQPRQTRRGKCRYAPLAGTKFNATPFMQ